VETLTVLTVAVGVLLLANEMPLGDTELGGFPVAYYLVLTLLFIGFTMRKRLKHGRRED
jgi:hypothetical protein